MSRLLRPVLLPVSYLLALSLIGICIVTQPTADRLTVAAEPAAAPDFNREVRPILAQYCFKCHGPDDKNRESGLRLDTRDGARMLLDSGTRAIAPGNPSSSELVRRIESTDENLVMPPPSTKKSLSAEQKNVLQRWIAAGAEYQPHWAFVAPRQTPVPPAVLRLADRTWPRSPLDTYVQSALQREKLGLTLVCSYCHTHKFDPIPQTEYYGMFAMLNNADEPEIAVPQSDVVRRRQDLEAQIAQLEADLPNQFPLADELRWVTPRVVSAATASGAKLEAQADGSLLVTGENPDVDRYTVVLEADAPDITALKLETLTHATLGGNGPGRTPHGNFLLTELSIQATTADQTSNAAQTVKIAGADAEIEQDTFPVTNAFDGNSKTGWAIHHAQQPLNRDRAATFRFAAPVGRTGRTRWTVQLDQQFGKQHTIGRFRIQLGQPNADSRPLAERRRAHLEKRFAQWLNDQQPRAVAWTVLRPATATSNLPLLTILDDNSILASGDQSKSDLYELRFDTVPAGVTAVRIEVLADQAAWTATARAILNLDEFITKE